MTEPTQQDAALRAFSIKRAAERLDTSPAALRYRVRRGFVHARRTAVQCAPRRKDERGLGLSPNRALRTWRTFVCSYTPPPLSPQVYH